MAERKNHWAVDNLGKPTYIGALADQATLQVLGLKKRDIILKSITVELLPTRCTVITGAPWGHDDIAKCNRISAAIIIRRRNQPQPAHPQSPIRPKRRAKGWKSSLPRTTLFARS